MKLLWDALGPGYAFEVFGHYEDGDIHLSPALVLDISTLKASFGVFELEALDNLIADLQFARREMAAAVQAEKVPDARL